jgi:hypothetical protein
MKYFIEGFLQEKLCEFELNSNDAIILRYIVDFYSTGQMKQKKIDDEFYFWVYYQNIIDELPILGIKNKEVVARHFTKFVRCGIMDKKVFNKGGKYTYFKLTNKFQELISSSESQSTIKSKPIDSKVVRSLDSKVETNDSDTKYNSNTKQSNIYIAEKKPDINYQLFEYWNENKNTTNHEFKQYGLKMQKKHKDHIKIYGFEETKKAIDNYGIIKSSPEYYWTHNYSFFRFITGGLEQFVDSAHPFDNFKSKQFKAKAYDPNNPNNLSGKELEDALRVTV